MMLDWLIEPYIIIILFHCCLLSTQYVKLGPFINNFEIYSEVVFCFVSHGGGSWPAIVTDANLHLYSCYQHVAVVSVLGLLLCDTYIKQLQYNLRVQPVFLGETGPWLKLTTQCWQESLQCHSLDTCLLSIQVLEAQSDLGPVCQRLWIQTEQHINKLFSDNVEYHKENTSRQWYRVMDGGRNHSFRQDWQRKPLYRAGT